MANLRADNLTGTGGRNAIDGSLFFSGADDYLDISNSVIAAAIPGGDEPYTIEMWVKIGRGGTSVDSGGSDSLIAWGANSTRSYNGIDWTGTAIRNVWFGDDLSYTFNLNDGAWHHVAATYDQTTRRLFVDGVLGASDTPSDHSVGTTNNGKIGASTGGVVNRDFKGYISNLRITKRAIYTAAFTPPTEKLTIVDDTMLLCCQDSDDATQEATGKTITGYGGHASVGVNENLVTNGNFTAGTTGWDDSLAPSETTLSSENQRLKVVASGGTGRARQAVTGLTIGNRYKFQIRHVTCASGNCFTHLGTSDGGAEIVTNLGLGEEDLHTHYFTATTTTVYIQTGITIGLTGYFDDVSLTLAEQPKAPKVFPPVGVDPGVVFDGDTKINSQGVMYFPTGDTSQRGRGRGVLGGGAPFVSPNVINNMQYIEVQSGGIFKDFGDLTVARGYFPAGQNASSTRGLNSGGWTGSGNVTIDYITIATTSNAIDFGETDVARPSAAVSNQTRSLTAGDAASLGDHIDYVTIASTGDAEDFGNLTEGRGYLAGVASPTRGVFGGGRNNTPSSNTLKITMEYVTIATTGHAQNFGDLSAIRYGATGFSSAVRGIFAGGYLAPGQTTTIDYFTIATLGNASDFGDLGTANGYCGSVTNSIRGAVTINDAPNYTNALEYITIATTGNAQDFGESDPTGSGKGHGDFPSSMSDSHGGTT